MPSQKTKPQSVDAYVANLEPPIRDIVTDLRALIREVAPELTESFKWSMPCYELHGHVCYLKAAKAHVSFGFERGGALSDPDGLLEGEGKQMRHIKLRLPEDIQREQFSAWLRQAVALNAQC